MKARLISDFGFQISDSGKAASPCAFSKIRIPSAFRNRTAFTLIEMLVVIAIIGLLTTIGLPAIKGMTKSNTMIAANRQLLDDLAYARQRAIADHTTVDVVFIPPNIVNLVQTKMSDLAVLTNLYAGQYTTYALISLRSVGDQPGISTPHYLTSWRTLPSGVFIKTNKFGLYSASTAISDYDRAFRQDVTHAFPFPTVNSNVKVILPYVEYNYLGQLTSPNNINYSEVIPLARGSIFYAQGPNGAFLAQPADVLETPAGNSTTISNVIHIDWATGRSHVERQEIQ